MVRENANEYCYMKEGDMKVLIVEDDDGTRFILGKVAKNEGHDVMTAPDGASGLAVFTEFRPDMVLSDIQMPKMDGLQLLERIRNVDHDVVVVMVSSLDTPEYTIKALRLRADDYLVKPAQEKDLLLLIRKYQKVILTRTKEREVVGLVVKKNLEMRVSNQLDLVDRIVDRLMQETEHHLPSIDRLGVHLGLVELVSNGIEHGNLEITYDEKTLAMEGGADAWQNLVRARMQQYPFSERFVTIEIGMGANLIEWVITDQGKGFDWTKIPDPNDPANLLSPHGRGIMLTQFRFDEMTYLGNGSKVRLVKGKAHR